MRMLLSSLLAAQLALAAGCGGEAPVAPERTADGPRETPQQASASIRDGAHGGPEGFYFLPPLVEQPAFDGTFDPARSPTVEICTLTDTGCEPVVATFTRQTGPGSETVRVDTVAEQYVVNWHTDQFELAEGQTYRIRVLLDGREAGHADVVAVTSGKELKSAETGETIALKDGRTLPIKFRIEEGLVLVDSALLFPPDSTPTAIYSDSSNVIEDPACSNSPFIRSIVVVTFKEGTTPRERQAAVDFVDGEVVGGVPLSEQGMYLVQVEDDETGSGVCAAEAALEDLPTVSWAATDDIAETHYRRPRDGTDWRSWRLEGDAADGENWALEAIDAPLAWGCATGSDSLPIMTIDDEIHVDGLTDLEANVDAANSNGLDFPSTFSHGTRVASVLAAEGDNDEQMTGVMWDARLQLQNYAVQTGPNSFTRITNALRIGLAGAEPSPRVLLLTSGAPWPAAPDEGDSNDVDRMNDWHRALRDALQSTTERFGIPMPLVVLSAGNDGIPAKWGGFAKVKEDFPDRVLVVGASTRDGSLWSSSNSGPLVQIAAPGKDVFSIEKRNGTIDVTSQDGTSLSAPMVAGVAGLLASFDPRLSAAQLKDKIIDGVERGGRTAGGFPLLNAHEALKLAAERDGAPLCGNRVWATDDAIVAERDGGTTETLRSSGLGADHVLGRVEALHGGKLVSFLRRDTTTGGTTDTLVIEWPGTSSEWRQVGTSVSDLRAVRGGTHASVFGLSHGRDTLAVIDGDDVWGTRWYETADRNQAPVRLQVPPGGTGTQVGAIPVEDFAEPLARTCLERDASNPDTCLLSTAESRFWLFRIGYPQFPSALGGRQASVAVSPLRDVVVDSTAWQPCDFDAARECRRVQTRQKQTEALAYRMDLAGTGNTPTLRRSIADQSIFWIGQGESGDEVVLGRGEWRITFWADPELFRRTGVLFTDFAAEQLACVIEYRDRATFERTREPVPAPDACFFAADFDELDPAAGGGTLAPSVRAGGLQARTTVAAPLVELLPEGPRPRRP